MELDEGDPSPPPPEDPLRLSDEHPEIVAAVAAQPQLPHPLPTHDTDNTARIELYYVL